MPRFSKDGGPLKQISRHWNHFFFGVASLLGGIYVWLHQGYLDDPRVTPPPPPPHLEQVIFGFADDWWFALWLIACGLVILYGTAFCHRKLRDWGMVALSPAFGAIAVVFSVRGFFDMRFNLTWIFALLTLALLFSTLMRGDHSER